jgi:hypothetical protein
MQARSRDLPRVDLQPWHALQRYLELGPRDVVIPYADWLAECCDVSAVRLRRDFAQLLRLIQAHALLHQEQRQKAAQGAVVATAEDYSAVYVLVADLVAEGVEATVSPRVREAVETVERLSKAASGASVRVTDISRELGLDRSVCSRRASEAVYKGWLIDQRLHKNRPAELVPGEPLPGSRSVLPHPSQLDPYMLPKTAAC